MALYGGIDFRANNNVVVSLDAADRAVYQQRLATPHPDSDIDVVIVFLDLTGDRLED